MTTHRTRRGLAVNCSELRFGSPNRGSDLSWHVLGEYGLQVRLFVGLLVRLVRFGVGKVRRVFGVLLSV